MSGLFPHICFTLKVQFECYIMRVLMLVLILLGNREKQYFFQSYLCDNLTAFGKLREKYFPICPSVLNLNLTFLHSTINYLSRWRSVFHIHFMMNVLLLKKAGVPLNHNLVGILLQLKFTVEKNESKSVY